MRPSVPRAHLPLLLLLLAPMAHASGPPMQYVGSLNPYPGVVGTTFSTVAVDTDRDVAYMAGVFSPQGVSVIDISDPSLPVFVYEIPNPEPIDVNNQPSPADVDLVGRYLAVSHHGFGRQVFRGVAIYDTQPDPYHPTLISEIRVSTCGIESAQLDPEAESGRPYVYCNSHCLSDPAVYVANILTGQVIGTFVGPEPFGCPPFPCTVQNAPHEAFVQRHPRSGKMLDYVGYWDSGLRIIDVTDPTNPVEAGAFDYGPGTGFRNAHGAVASPSGDYVYVGDEFAFEERGGIHVFDARACDGTSHCTPVPIAFWQRQSDDAGAPPETNSPVFFASFVAYDVHNMSPLGENALLVGNYRLGVRLLDVTDKADPQEISFYNPNNIAGTVDDPGRPFFSGRRTYNAVRGNDGLIYGGDMTMGFFVCSLHPNTVLPSGAAAFARGARDQSDPGSVRVSAGRGNPEVQFTTRKPGRSELAIFDISGRLVRKVVDDDQGVGSHRLSWDSRTAGGARAARGVYLGRLTTPDGARSVKLVHLGE